MPVYHQPVMTGEVLEFLAPEPGDICVDGTVGEGGHAVLMAPSVKPGGLLIGIDRDPENLKEARRRLSGIGADFMLFKGSYSCIRGFLGETGLNAADAVLLDLGFSLRHIKASGRGFSFLKDEILDMRYDTSSGRPVCEWLESAERREIAQVIRKFGEEQEAARIAAEIKKIIGHTPLRSLELAEAVSRVKRTTGRTHPATKVFQALRIFINSELEELKKGLEESLSALSEGGRMAVLTYHSIEDRIVKNFLKAHSGRCTCPPRMPVCSCSSDLVRPLISVTPGSGRRPSADEIESNPRARSARLRVCTVIKTA